jgi:hypothetical protein
MVLNSDGIQFGRREITRRAMTDWAKPSQHSTSHRVPYCPRCSYCLFPNSSNHPIPFTCVGPSEQSRYQSRQCAYQELNSPLKANGDENKFHPAFCAHGVFPSLSNFPHMNYRSEYQERGNFGTNCWKSGVSCLKNARSGRTKRPGIVQKNSVQLQLLSRFHACIERVVRTSREHHRCKENRRPGYQQTPACLAIAESFMVSRRGRTGARDSLSNYRCKSIHRSGRHCSWKR